MPRFARLAVLLLLIAATATPFPARSQALTVPAIGLLQGLRPEVVSSTVMRFHDGVATDALGTTQIAVTRFRDTHAYLEVDLAHVGLNGRDTDSFEEGHYFFYLMRSLRDNAVGIVASRADAYGGVTQPPGGPWVMRKLPYGHPYRAEFGGFAPVHVDAWPHPTVIFTDSEYSGTWMALLAGGAQDWEDVDVSRWIPSNARLGHFIFETRDAGHRAPGACFVRSYGGQPVGLLVGESMPRAPSALLSAAVRISSAQRLQYRCSRGSRLLIQVRGFSITEAP
jgi:hypothetical protein